MCDYSPNREAAMTVISEKVWCDPCISPIVKALNDAGLVTIASCCGHGRRPGIITLLDGTELLIMKRGESNIIGGLWPGINDEPKTHVLQSV